MAKGTPGNPVEDALDELIGTIVADSLRDGERYRAFQKIFEDKVRLPADAFVLGEPASVIAIACDGNERRGLRATCRKEDRTEYTIGLVDVAFPAGAPGAPYLDAYKKWAGIEPDPVSPMPKRKHAAAEQDIDISRPVSLILLHIKQGAARCRIPGTERMITLRSRDVWRAAPGEIVAVRARRIWRFKGNPYLSGDVESRRIDIPALGLCPLRLDDRGMWDPRDDYWREEGERLSPWEEKILKRGLRPSFEMEQILPGCDPEDPFDDPIVRANDLKAGGDVDGAYRLLMELAEADLRCLDAHCHLGNIIADSRPDDALRHYEIGRRIGELSLGENFDNVLLWGFIDNRPFLRCMHGHGLCLWRLGRFEEAAAVFERMLHLNPPDNQGIRFILPEVQERRDWMDDEKG